MIEIRNVTKQFKNNVVLDDISLQIESGEITVLIGPSGCGKTTTLKMLNRLIPPTKGDIFIDGKNIRDQEPVRLRRNIGYVIQQGGLFPHMTIRENIEIIQRLEGKSPESIIKNTRRLMEMVDLEPEQYLGRYPSELSGGQQQRIGVIRAMANDPDIILFDEPFSALDPVTRANLQDELIELQNAMHKTMVFVTHDMDEAIKIADRICIMKDGHVLQYDTPDVILKNPATDFVRDFVGANRIWDSPEYILVEDFMIRYPITCKTTMNRNRCVKRMRDHRIDSLLVVDERQKLLGVIKRKDLFQAPSPTTLAGDMMRHVEHTAKPKDNILSVLKAIEESEITNIPVVGEDDRLIGLLTNSSLISTLSRRFLADDTINEAVDMEDVEREAEAAGTKEPAPMSDIRNAEREVK